MGSFRFPTPGSTFRSLALVAFASGVLTPALYAQSIEITPAHVSVVDGRASLERDGQVQDLGGGMPFVPGDNVRSEAGRVEILFPDGSALDIDEFTSVDLMSPTLLRVTAGRVLLVVFGANNPSSAVRYQIDTPSASARTDGPGEYRVSIFNGSPALQTELAVTRGWAALSTESGTTPVRAGERTLAADGQAPTPPQMFNSARFDAFDRWVSAQHGDRTGVASSAQYLPDDLRVYSNDFDRNGSWGYEATYGNVWYPAVTPGWRPYYNGYWSSVPSYGWTWIGYDRWAWPTHHYGRWGYYGNRWFWAPGRHWAPAWVSWGVAPGYVSWCPLGFNNQPVFALSVGVGNFWAGWTVVPRTRFGHGYVGQWAVSANRLGPAPFARSMTPPVPVPPMGRAVPRVVANGSQGGAVAPSFANRQAAESRPQVRPRNPQALTERSTQSPAFSGSDRRSGSVVLRHPGAAPGQPPQSTDSNTGGGGGGVAPVAPQRRTGGWVVPRQPVVVAPGNSAADIQGQPGSAPITRQPGRQQVVRPAGREGVGLGGQQVVRPGGQEVVEPGGQQVVRSRNPYMPSIANPYGRQTESVTAPRSNSPGVAAPQNSQAPAIAPRAYGRENSNTGARQGSAVPRNESNGGGRQEGNAGGQQSNGGGAQSGARQGQSGGGGGARQRHP
jgi:Family of unknown function (DUF6600)